MVPDAGECPAIGRLTLVDEARDFLREAPWCSEPNHRRVNVEQAVVDRAPGEAGPERRE